MAWGGKTSEADSNSDMNGFRTGIAVAAVPGGAGTGAGARIRTADLLITNQLLYP